MSLKTEEERYLIVKEENSYYRIQVLEGDDEGKRIHIPKYNKNYNKKIKNEIKKLCENDIIKVCLEKEENSSYWYFNSIEIIYKN